jgi:DNA-binding transcriptional ArsR family regulator
VPQPPFTIERPDQLKALGHPLRLRVLELLADSQPLTNRELASQLGIDPGHLHFHVRMLLSAGLIELADSGRGREKPYRAVAQQLHISPELRATGLAGNAQAAMIETVSRGWAAFGARGRFRSVKATAHVSAETLQQLLRDFFERVREAEEAAIAAGSDTDELLVSVFYHPPPPQSSTAEHVAAAGSE